MRFKDGTGAVAVWYWREQGYCYFVAAKTRKRACEIEGGVKPEMLKRVKNLWAIKEGSVNT